MSCFFENWCELVGCLFCFVRVEVDTYYRCFECGRCGWLYSFVVFVGALVFLGCVGDVVDEVCYEGCLDVLEVWGF